MDRFNRSLVVAHLGCFPFFTFLLTLRWNNSVAFMGVSLSLPRRRWGGERGGPLPPTSLLLFHQINHSSCRNCFRAGWSFTTRGPPHSASRSSLLREETDLEPEKPGCIPPLPLALPEALGPVIGSTLHLSFSIWELGGAVLPILTHRPSRLARPVFSVVPGAWGHSVSDGFS